MRSSPDIDPKYTKIIQNILNQNLPAGARTWVFGSRANGTAEKYSDVDIALECDTVLDYKIITDLEIAFEESVIPYTVDIVDLKRINNNIKNIINKYKVELSLQ